MCTRNFAHLVHMGPDTIFESCGRNLPRAGKFRLSNHLTNMCKMKRGPKTTGAKTRGIDTFMVELWHTTGQQQI